MSNSLNTDLLKLTSAPTTENKVSRNNQGQIDNEHANSVEHKAITPEGSQVAAQVPKSGFGKPCATAREGRAKIRGK